MSNTNLTTLVPITTTRFRSAKNACSMMSRNFAKGTLATLAVSAMLASGMAAPANAALSATGPIDPVHGFPTWFEDQNGLRLDLCYEGALCLGALPDPTQPVGVPTNFPDEAFWWAADAAIEAGGVDASLVLAQEAAWTNEVAEAGEQVVFSRLRIRISGLTPGAIYTITHPYGTISLPADPTGVINYTKDYGCFDTPCTAATFDRALNGPVSGPFLTWDTGAPVGYIGDPNVEHIVTGSPTGNNFFQVEGPNVGGEGVDSIRTDLFAIQGKISGVDAPTPPPPAVDPVDEEPVDEEPVDEAPPVDGVPVDEEPVEEAPPVDGVPVDEAPPVDEVAEDAAKDAAKAAEAAARAEAKAAEEAARAQAAAVRDAAKAAEATAKAEARAAEEATRAQAAAVRDAAKAAEATAKAEARAAEEATRAQAAAVRDAAKAAEATAKAEARAAEEAVKAQAKAAKEAAKTA